MTDKHHRTIFKTLSWRITGTIDTILVAWLITGTFKLALSIGGIEIVTKMILYYFHERIWNKIDFGRENKKTPEYHI
ncbi:MAG: DUF2061 domain-containing protein [Bacteroidetes bacterium]|nr:DUF2061 domain-containing protein [Bacteroidota bacterium]